MLPQIVTYSVLKRPKPVVSGCVMSGYMSCPLCKHCGHADKQQFKHVGLM